MFWNEHYANAIRAAGQAGAKVIALDLAFGVPIDKWEPDADELLAGAISTSPVPVVVGYVSEINSNQQSQSIPVNMMAAALGLGAFANLTTDDDDFIRNQELMEAPSANPADPPPARSLAMRTVEKYIGTDAQFQKGALLLQGHAIPISPRRSIAINYAGPPNTFPSVSLADFEAAAKAGNTDQLRKWVEGKIVLLGTDFVDDRFDTPFYTLFSGSKWTMPGVEIHANTVRTLLTRSYPDPRAAMGAGAGAAVGHNRDGSDRHVFCGQPRRGPGAARSARHPGCHAPVIRTRSYPLHLRGAAGDIGELDCVPGLPLRHRGDSRQSVPSRGIRFCRQTTGFVARRVATRSACPASAWR